MGCQNSACGTYGGNESELYFTAEEAKSLTKQDLDVKQMQIGENGYESPLTRSAMLNEDFSHIYDDEFAENNMSKLRLIQGKVRAVLAQLRFKEIRDK